MPGYRRLKTKGFYIIDLKSLIRSTFQELTSLSFSLPPSEMKVLGVTRLKKGKERKKEIGSTEFQNFI